MRTALDDPAVVEDHDLIGVADGREPVGDRECGAALRELVECLLNRVFGLRVERARRLVQDEDRRVAKDRASDRDALLLTAREAVAALADNGVVALRQRSDQVIDARRPRCGLDLLVGRLRPSEAEVFAN